MESGASSGRDEDSEQRGSTIKSKDDQAKIIVTYNKKGVPIGDGAVKLATFEGLAARSMVPITYESWRHVGEETKEEVWQYILMNFVVDLNNRKQIIQSIGTKWKNFKHYLYKKFIHNYKNENDPYANLLDPPAMYPFLKKEDWKLFVAQRLSEKWEEKSSQAKKVRANHKYNHRISRKGYARLTEEIMQQTGMTEEEIDRTMLWKKAREKKKGGYDPNVQVVVDRVEELQNAENFEEVSSGTSDVLTQALGTEEQRGHVRGMGKYVKPHQYFFLPKTVKQYFDIENKKLDERFNKIECAVEKLKRGAINVYEGASCQVGDNEDFQDEPLDTSCYLAVDSASNIVAKGTIVKYNVTGENIEVIIWETFEEGEVLLPIPLDEEFIFKVNDAVGHVISWPRHLVIRCSDLEKVTAKPMGKYTKPIKQQKLVIKKKRPREPDEYKEERKEKVEAKETEKVKEAEQEKEISRIRTRIRIENSRVLKLCARIVDTKVSKEEYVKVQYADDLFGYESYGCLFWDDFEAVFTLDELTGACITTYMMYLFEEIKNGPKKDRGICFVSPSAISPPGHNEKFIHSDEASRSIVDRMSKRKEDDIILVPFNPGRHWVLAVIDLKTSTCYYLDSLRPRNVDLQLKKFIDAAMVLYTSHSGSNKRVKLNWINVLCPLQPGITECGYYMLKFMKEVVEKGVEVLINKNVGGGRDEYTDAEIDDIREEWVSFVTSFIYR